jgi:hypothetical protein
MQHGILFRMNRQQQLEVTGTMIRNVLAQAIFWALVIWALAVGMGAL